MKKFDVNSLDQSKKISDHNSNSISMNRNSKALTFMNSPINYNS